MNSKKIKCKVCGSENISLYSRIVGYFSEVKGWNSSKIEELKSRKKGNYKV